MKNLLTLVTLILLLSANSACKTEKPDVPQSNNIYTVSDVSYQSFVKSDKLVILYFKMNNCKFCAEMEPVIDKIAAKYHCNSIIGKIQYENNPDLTLKFSVKSFPVTFFLINETVVDTLSGSWEYSVVEKIVSSYESGCK